MLEDVFHYYCILSCIPIDCSLILTFTNISSCWPGLGSLLRRDVNPCLNSVVLHSDTDTLLWYLPGDVLAAPASALCGWTGVMLLFLSLAADLQGRERERERSIPPIQPQG